MCPSQILSPSDNDIVTELTSSVIETQYQRSHSFGDNKILNEPQENIFAARPIHVEEDDPILKNAKKLPYLSTDERDFYLLPVNDDPHHHSSDNSISTVNDSLTYSEDSDTTRVYNLNSCRTEILKDSVVETKLSLQLPNNLLDKDQNNNNNKTNNSDSEINTGKNIKPIVKKTELVINLEDSELEKSRGPHKKPVFTGKITKMNEDYVKEFFEVEPDGVSLNAIQCDEIQNLSISIM